MPFVRDPFQDSQGPLQELTDTMKHLTAFLTTSKASPLAASATIPTLPQLSFGNYPEERALIFLDKFRSYCTFGQLTEDAQLRMFPMLLRDEAYLWYEEQGPFSSFAALEVAFSTYFSPVEEEANNLCDFYASFQGPEEPITHYITRIRQQNQLLHHRLTEAHLLIIVQHNVTPRVKLDISGRRFRHLQELQRAVLEVEVLRQQVRDQQNERLNHFRPWQPQPQGRPSRPIDQERRRTCWNCRRPGHIARFCNRAGNEPRGIGERTGNDTPQ